MARRILDEVGKSTFTSDDYLYIDSATDGSSKITPDNLVRNTTVAQQLAQHISDAEEEVEQITTDIEGIQSDINDVKSDIDEIKQGGSGSGLTEDVKVALLNCFENVAWKDDDPTGRTYIDALEDALYPPADLVSISAVYTQSGTVYDTDTLDSLKTDLVVTAHMSDSTTQTVTTYTLSGTLTEGTSTITVAYGGKTTTFTVTVSHQGTSDMDEWTDGVAYTNLDVVQNEYCSSADGSFKSYNGWDRTGYVYCGGATTIAFPEMPNSTSGTAVNGSNSFYAEDKSRISRFDTNQSGTATITVPTNAAYFVISGTSNDVANAIETGIVPHA